MAKEELQARRYLVRGTVQGVGFRNFARLAATELGVMGYVRNEDDGRVLVYAVGTESQLNALAGRLHQGPRWAAVRDVEEQSAAVQQYSSFRIAH